MHHSNFHICFRKAVDTVSQLCLLLFGLCVGAVPASAQISTENAIAAGKAAVYYDDYITTIHYMNLALEAKPYLAEAYYYRGMAHFYMDDFIAAEEDLSKAIAFNPFHVEYFQLRGLCRIHNEHYAGAIDDYTRVLDEMPEDQNCQFNRALCRYEIKDYERANTELSEIIRRWPRFARAYVVKAQTCLEQNDTTQGLYWIDSLLVLSKREPNAWSVKGNYALNHQDYALADSCFSQALKYDAGNVSYYMQRAKARYLMGRYRDAYNDYSRVVIIDPGNQAAAANSQMMAEMAISPEKARKRHRFVEDNSNYSIRSVMEEFKGKVENRSTARVFLPAYRAEDKHLIVDGGRHPVYCPNKSFLELITKTTAENVAKIPEAIQTIRSYIEGGNEDAVLYYNLGCLEAEGGDLFEADKAFSRAISIDPLMAEAYYNKAVVLLLQNKNEMAEPLLARAGEMGIYKSYNILKQAKTK